MITQIIDDIDWAYFYSQISWDVLPDDIKEKLIYGFDFTESLVDMKIIWDIITKHKAKSLFCRKDMIYYEKGNQRCL